LLCALVVVGKGLSTQSDKLAVESSNAVLSNLSLLNRFNPTKSVNSIDTSDSKYNKKQHNNMSISKTTSKMMEHLTFRLPRNVRPHLYNLFLNPDLRAKTFTGNVKIDFNVTDSAPFVALHSKFLNVTTNKLIRIIENGAEAIPIKNSFFFEKYEYYVIEPETQLTAGDYSIDLNFDGKLSGLVGFYGSTYFDKISNRSR